MHRAWVPFFYAVKHSSCRAYPRNDHIGGVNNMIVHPCQYGHHCIYALNTGRAIYCKRGNCEFRGHVDWTIKNEQEKHERDPRNFREWDRLIRKRPNKH